MFGALDSLLLRWRIGTRIGIRRIGIRIRRRRRRSRSRSRSRSRRSRRRIDVKMIVYLLTMTVLHPFSTT
jgi:hypothetical protein